jgi:hypothetical protein
VSTLELSPAQEVAPVPAIESPAERLEGIAQKIESVQSVADFMVAKLLAEAQEVFRYKRDERGGFTGWVKTRLNISKSEVYRLLRARERFGGSESFPNWETLALALPRSAIHLLADPATPDEVCQEVGARVAAGEKLPLATVAGLIERAKTKAVTSSANGQSGGNGAAVEEDPSIAERRAQHAAMFDEDEPAAGSGNDTTVDSDADDDAGPDYSVDHDNDAGDAEDDHLNAAIDRQGAALADNWAWVSHVAKGDRADAIQGAIIQAEPVDRLLALMSTEQRDALAERLVGQETAPAAGAMPNGGKSLLADLTKKFRWALEHTEPANGAQALTAIATKLRANNRGTRDLIFAWAKPRGKRAD